MTYAEAVAFFRKLSPEQREQLWIEAAASTQVEEEMLEEMMARARRVRAGEVELLDGDKVMADVRARLKQTALRS